MKLILQPLFASIISGHFVVDMLNGSRSVLLAYWGLSGAEIGIISAAYVWSASLTQPVFGWLADRFGSRWLTGGGVLWMVVFYSLAMTLPTMSLALSSLVLASLGSSAFHPPGTMQATLQGRKTMGGRETTAASYFFMFGQLGLFLGPVLTGLLLGNLDTRGLLILSAVSLPVGLNLLYRLRTPGEQRTSTEPRPERVRLTVSWQFIAALALVAGLQSWAQQNMINFVPKYLSDLGQSAAVYGNLAGLFMGGSAIGNVIGGILADRYGKRTIAMVALMIASIPLYIIAQIGWSTWLYLLIPLAGALTGAVHSIIVVIAQRALKGGMALASGLILGFIFSAGALGTLLTGHLADTIGYPPIFLMTVGLVLAASVFTLVLPKTTT